MAELKTVTLKFACNQKWDSMTPVAGGRMCGVCDKKVIDFSNKTQEQFNRAFIETGGKLCGRFSAQTEVKTIGQNVRPWRNAAIVAGAASLVFAGCKTKPHTDIWYTGTPVMGGDTTRVNPCKIAEVTTRNLGLRNDSLFEVAMPKVVTDSVAFPQLKNKTKNPCPDLKEAEVLAFYTENVVVPENVNYEGNFKLTLNINKRGRVKNVTFDSELPEQLRKNIIIMSKKMRFKPTKKGDKKVPCIIVIPMGVHKKEAAVTPANN